MPSNLPLSPASSRAILRSRRGDRIRTEPGRTAPRRLPLSVAIAAALMLGTPVSLSSAAERKWDGGGTTNNWSNGSNWNGNTDIALDGTDSIVFAAVNPSRLTTGVQNLVGLRILGLTYNADAGASIIGGTESLTILTGGITNNTGLAQALNMPVIIGANQIWSSNAALNLGGGISFVQGAIGVTLSGSGSFNVTGNISSGSGANTIKLDGGTLNFSGSSISVFNFYAGFSAGSNGNFTLLSGKTHTSTNFGLAIDSGSSGTYTLAGGTLNVTNSISNGLGTGTLNLDGGTFNVAGASVDVDNFNVGNAANSTASFTLGSGKTHSFSNLGLGIGTNSNGTYTLAGGTLNVTNSVVNNAGTGTLNIDGGTFNFTGTSLAVDNFNIGNAANSTGSFTLGSSKTHTVTNLGLGIGTNSSGTYTVAGGTLNATNLTLGAGAGNSATLTLTSGSLNVTNSIANNGAAGTINIDGGTFNFAGTLLDVRDFNVGSAPNSAGSFTLGNGKTHTVTNLGLGIGTGSSGTYTLSGGTLNASNLILGAGTGSNATLNLKSGTLNVTNSIVDNAGTGTLNLDGGSLNVAGSSIAVDNFNVGNAVGSFASFTLLAGKTQTVTNLGIGIGATAIATYTLAGGTLSVANAIQKGGGGGTFNLDGGTLNLTGTSFAVDNFNVGNAVASFASFSLLAGKTQTVTNLGIGIGATAMATYTLAGGTLSVTNAIQKGGGAGTFNLDGGVLNFTGASIAMDNFNVGNAANSSGSFTLRPGQTHTVTNLGLGVGAGSSGTYNLAGGTLNVTSPITNNAGTGTLNIDGGTLNVAGASIDVDRFNVANAAGSSASFTLAAGNTLTVTNLGIGVGNGAIGTYTLAGGTLNVTNSIVRGGGVGTFNFDGGTLNAAGASIVMDTFNVANAGGAVASFALLAGKSLSVINLGLGVGAGSNGTFTLAGGNLVVDGTVTNTPGMGTLNIDSGTFNFAGTSINVDNFNLGSSAGSNASFTLRAGKTQTAANLGLGLGANSSGTYFVQGGTLTVTGSVTKGPGISNLVVDGGTFNAGVSVEVDNFRVGNAKDATGSFNMLAGTHTVNNLGLGLGANSKGTYTLSGGTLNVGSIARGAGTSDFHFNGGTLNLGTTMDVGTFHIASAAGSNTAFTLTDGQAISVTNLAMAEGSGSKATFNLAGGSLTSDATMIAMYGQGIFQQTGGTHTVGSLRSGLPDDQRPNGAYYLLGGTLNAGSIGNGYSGYGNPNLYVNGGTLNLGSNGGISVDRLGIGDMQGRTGSLAIGTGQMVDSEQLFVGGSGTGTLTVSGGGSAYLGRGFINGGGTLSITGLDPVGGAASSLNVSSYLQINGPANVETMRMANGANAYVDRLLLYSGTVNVTGANTFLGSGSLEVGWGNGAALNVTAGASAQAYNDIWIGINSGISGVVTVAGSGSTMTSYGAIRLGVSGATGTLAIGDGGLVSGGQGVQIGTPFFNGSKVSLGAGGRLVAPSVESNGGIEFTGGAAALEANVVSRYGSRIVATGNSNATINGDVEIQNGAELRVTQGSVASFIGRVSLNNGSILTGTGTKVYAGRLSVGNSPGLANDPGSVTFAATNTYLAEIASTNVGDALGNGLGFDRLVVAGKLTFGGTLWVVQLAGYVPQAGQRFDLFDWGTSEGQFADFNFTGAPLESGLTWDTSRLYTDGTLSVAAVPEPSGYAMMLAGMGLMGFMVRRRRQSAKAQP